jgi:dolichyl-phosphate beta-glucosyltransferase
MPRYSLILPAYNEVSAIANTLESAIHYFEETGLSYEIIVAADGTDGTRECAAKFTRSHPNVKVIGSPQRRGKGRGIREAVALATGEIIGFADADNKVPIEELDKLAPYFTQGYEIVIGSRALPESIIQREQPWYRRVGARCFRWFLRLVLPIRGIADTQCGFKFFTRAVAEGLFSIQRIDGYMFDAEILFIAQYLNFTVKQVPVTWKDDGDSRLDLLGGNVRNVMDVVRTAWRWRPEASLMRMFERFKLERE